MENRLITLLTKGYTFWRRMPYSCPTKLKAKLLFGFKLDNLHICTDYAEVKKRWVKGLSSTHYLSSNRTIAYLIFRKSKELWVVFIKLPELYTADPQEDCILEQDQLKLTWVRIPSTPKNYSSTCHYSGRLYQSHLPNLSSVMSSRISCWMTAHAT